MSQRCVRRASHERGEGAHHLVLSRKAKELLRCSRQADPMARWRRRSKKGALTELVERLSALYAHYRIDPDQTGAESRLLLALAMAHVPGCRVVPSRELGGRAPTSVAELDPFVRDVERLTKKGHSVSRACELLSKRQPYLRLKLKAATLRRRFYEVTRGKNNDRDGIRAARRHHTQGSTAEGCRFKSGARNTICLLLFAWARIGRKSRLARGLATTCVRTLVMWVRPCLRAFLTLERTCHT
jgi:hypothetical protein